MCVREDVVPEILKACHDEPCGGHFYEKRTSHKMLLWDIIGHLFLRMLKDM